MASAGEWTHIDGDAWELYGARTHYTIHGHNGQWVVRGFSLDDEGGAHPGAEQSVQTLEDAKEIVQKWETKRSLPETH